MEELPVLDIRSFRVDASERNGERLRFVDGLGEALTRFGFVAISGHDIGESLSAPAYLALRRFFALPEATKRSYTRAESGYARGYTPFRVETAKDQRDPDLKEFFHVGRELAPANPYGMPPNVWPIEVPEFGPSMLALWSALERLGNELLSATALYLGLDERWFEDKVDHGNSILRALHYPPLRDGVRGVRSAAHEDINLITLLISSGEPGLEILRRDGTWLAIAPAADQLVVNVGDMLQRLTNHVLVSTTHRVINPGAPWDLCSRYSIPFFLHLNPEFLIRTLPSTVSADRPDLYPEPIRADDYLKQRLREIGLL